LSIVWYAQIGWTKQYAVLLYQILEPMFYFYGY